MNRSWHKSRPRQAVHPANQEFLRILGLKIPFTEEDLNEAFRLAAKTHHPDIGGDTKEFIRLQQAYDQARQYLRQPMVMRAAPRAESTRSRPPQRPARKPARIRVPLAPITARWKLFRRRSKWLLAGAFGLAWLISTLVVLQVLNWNTERKIVDLGGEFHVTSSGEPGLTLRDTGATDENLALLKGQRQLASLDLSGTAVSDQGLRQLRRMKALKDLDLSRTKVSDNGLRYLLELFNLRELRLDDTQISDRGLVLLSELKNLNRLSVRATNTSDGAIQRLSESIHVDWDGPPMPTGGIGSYDSECFEFSGHNGVCIPWPIHDILIEDMTSGYLAKLGVRNQSRQVDPSSEPSRVVSSSSPPPSHINEKSASIKEDSSAKRNARSGSRRNSGTIVPLVYRAGETLLPSSPTLPLTAAPSIREENLPHSARAGSSELRLATSDTASGPGMDGTTRVQRSRLSLRPPDYNRQQKLPTTWGGGIRRRESTASHAWQPVFNAGTYRALRSRFGPGDRLPWTHPDYVSHALQESQTGKLDPVSTLQTPQPLLPFLTRPASSYVDPFETQGAAPIRSPMEALRPLADVLQRPATFEPATRLKLDRSAAPGPVMNWRDDGRTWPNDLKPPPPQANWP